MSVSLGLHDSFWSVRIDWVISLQITVDLRILLEVDKSTNFFIWQQHELRITFSLYTSFSELPSTQKRSPFFFLWLVNPCLRHCIETLCFVVRSFEAVSACTVGI
jgi:hypothetical protein